MQEEVEHRSVTLIINSAKFSGRVLKAAISKYMAHRRSVHNEKKSKDVTPRGKMSVKQLAKQNQGMSSSEMQKDDGIKQFEHVCRKYGVDYAVRKVKGDNPKYVVFFKGRDQDAIKSAFTEFIREHFDGMRLPRSIVPPILDTFGADRVSYVLANTLQSKSWDGRFGKDNLEWAQTIPIKPDLADSINKNSFCIVETHPAVLDGFVRHVRKVIEERSRPTLADQLKAVMSAPATGKHDRPKAYGMER